MKRPFAAVSASLVCLVLLALLPIEAQQSETPQISSARFRRTGDRAIQNQYIVVLDRDATGRRGDDVVNAREIEELMPVWAGTVTRRFNHALNGFAALLTEEQALSLSEDSRVAFVEEDAIVEAFVTQSNPPWGLDRIGQRDLPLNAAYSYTTTGAGVNAYIIDTGIRRTHTQFGGRAVVGFDAIGDGQNTNDCNGHGTHVSGTVGGSTYGVAKGVRLFAVRVLSCSGSGSTSGVIAGVDWVTANHIDAGSGQHESRRRGVDRARHGGAQFHCGGRDLRDRGGQFEFERGELFAGACDPGDYGGFEHQDRCALVVLELRQRGRYLRARIEHPLRVSHEQYRDRHAQRHVDGGAACRGRGRAVPAVQSGRQSGKREKRARQRRDAQSSEWPAGGNGQPAALLGEQPIAGGGVRLANAVVVRAAAAFAS